MSTKKRNFLIEITEIEAEAMMELMIYHIKELEDPKKRIAARRVLLKLNRDIHPVERIRLSNSHDSPQSN